MHSRIPPPGPATPRQALPPPRTPPPLPQGAPALFPPRLVYPGQARVSRFVPMMRSRLSAVGGLSLSVIRCRMWSSLSIGSLSMRLIYGRMLSKCEKKKGAAFQIWRSSVRTWKTTSCVQMRAHDQTRRGPVGMNQTVPKVFQTAKTNFYF